MVQKRFGAKLFLYSTDNVISWIYNEHLGNCVYCLKELISLPKVLDFNIWEVYNLVYYIALQNVSWLQASAHMKILVFVGKDASLDKSMKYNNLGLSKFRHIKKPAVFTLTQ